MSDNQFELLGKEVLNKIEQMEEYSKIYPKLYKIQAFILNNPNNKYAQNFIVDLINTYMSLFLKKELIDAFNLPDSLYYYKQLQIYLNLPYTTHPLYATYLPQILTIPSEIYGDIYGTFIYVLQKYVPEKASNPYLQAILDFVKQNPSIMRGSKDNYYSLNDEIKLLNKVKSGSSFKELEEFAFAERLMNHYIIINSFYNKRIGDIGEIYTYELIRTQFFNCFVSRDVKNGFGYDIYFLDNDSIENLVEVKTTTNNSEDDFFSMSENEYKEMKKCINNPNARYIICRVKLDSFLNPSYTLLTMVDDVTLADTQNEGIEYKLCPSTNNSIYFKRYKPNMRLSL